MPSRIPGYWEGRTCPEEPLILLLRGSRPKRMMRPDDAGRPGKGGLGEPS